MPWQQDTVDVALEYDPVTGLYRYSEVDITVPRQSGKSTLTLAKKVHRLTVMARRLGPQRSTYTAQTRLAARKKLERDFAESLRRSRSFREVPHSRARPTKATEWRLSLNNGSEAIQFGTGSYLQIDAPSRTGGHGDTLDDGDIDEAFSQEDDTVEAAMVPSMATRKNAQLWVVSTAGDSRSAYLYRKILAGRAATESGSHGRVCYVEFSAPDDADPADPDVWRSCMPALGITITEDFILGEWERAQRKGLEGINTFRRAYLNQWPDPPVLDAEDANRVLSAAAWKVCLLPDAVMVGKAWLAVDVSPAQTNSSIAAAGYAADGRTVIVKVLANGEGTSWVASEVRRLQAEHRTGPVGYIRGTAAESLISSLTDLDVQVAEVTSAEYAAACGDFLTRTSSVDRGLIHTGQPVLDAAVANAGQRVTGDKWVWDRRVKGVDITPLCAVTTATHLVVNPPTIKQPGRFVSF